MAIEKEALTHKIEDDLAARNRNWDKVETHLAESASKHITESGSNENGSYIKFDDGTMICYGRITKTLAITIPFGTLFRNDNDTLIIEYPVQFYNTAPALSVANSGSQTVFFANQTNLTTLNAKMYAMRPTSVTANLLVDWQAIGRWKA